MKKTLFKFPLLIIMVLRLPMLGVIVARKEIAAYLDFPPKTWDKML